MAVCYKWNGQSWEIGQATERYPPVKRVDSSTLTAQLNATKEMSKPSALQTLLAYIGSLHTAGETATA
jgi:hypothetical protein